MEGTLNTTGIHYRTILIPTATVQEQVDGLVRLQRLVCAFLRGIGVRWRCVFRNFLSGFFRISFSGFFRNSFGGFFRGGFGDAFFLSCAAVFSASFCAFLLLLVPLFLFLFLVSRRWFFCRCIFCF